MGVNGGTTNIIGHNLKKIDLWGVIKYADCGKLKVVIDAPSVLNRYVIGSFNTGNYVVNEKGEKIMEIYYLLIIAIRFLSIGIIPIFVFDGRSPELKSNTIENRRKSKDKAEEVLDHLKIKNDKVCNKLDIPDDFSNCLQTEQMSSEVDVIKYLKRSYRPNSTNVQNAKLLLGHMGIPVIDSPEEADPQCAAIASVHDNIIGVITDDFDALMFMSPNILRMTSLGNSILQECSLQNTLNYFQQKIKSIIETSNNMELKKKYENKQIIINHDNFREICCLMGTDYCPGLTFYGKDNFNQLLELYASNDMSLRKVLSSNKFNETYVTRMLDSLDLYKNAKVLDPNEINISMKKPSIDIVKNICMEFLQPNEVTKICNLLTKVHGDNNTKTETFNNTWPEPGYLTPIVITK